MAAHHAVGRHFGDTLADWSHHPAWELFSGTLCYRTRLDLPPVDAAHGLELDPGRVGDLAGIVGGGVEVGLSLWAPYRIELSRLAAGPHDFDIHITNSMANQFEGTQQPSGLMGPLCLCLHHHPTPREESQ